MNQQPNRPSRPAQPRRKGMSSPAPGGYVHSNLTYRRRKAPSVTGALIYAVLFLLVILICLLVIVQSRRAEGESEDTRYVPIEISGDASSDSETVSGTDGSLDSAATDTTAPPVNEEPAFIGPPSPIVKPKYETITVENTKIAEGNLILINYEHPYVFPESQPQTVLYGNKSPVYVLSRADISLNKDLFPIFDGMLLDFYNATGCRDVLVTSGYRSYEFQQQLLADRIASQGEETARQYVAEPGHSEHHAGLAIDMVIFAGGQQYYFPEYDLAAWIVENAPSYGFILRYTEENQEITKCAPEPWHYRYIGAPHARLVTELGISFEEYHGYLRQYTWEEKRLLIAPDGTVSETDGLDLPDSGHMVYYVPASAGTETALPVPPGSAYEISGTNTDGFFVTVTLG